MEDGLLSALKEVEEPPSLELEFAFKDGSVRKMPATLKPAASDFWFYRKADSREEVGVSRS